MYDRPLVSVIVIIYQVAPFLEKCLDSLVNQTYKNLEIILSVGIGGNDNSEEICEEFAKRDSRIRLVKTKPKGVADARNQGMKYVHGEFVAFIDGDDWYEPDMYESMVNNMMEYHADISICGKYEEFQTMIRHSRAIPVKKMTPIETFERIYNMKDFGLHTWDKLFRVTLLDGIKFPMIKESEDRFVMYRIIDRAQAVVYDSSPKYHFRIRSDSCSRTEKNAIVSLDADLLMCRYTEEKYGNLEAADVYLFYSYYSLINSKVFYGSYDIRQDKNEMKQLKSYAKKIVLRYTTPVKTKIKAMLCLMGQRYVVWFMKKRNRAMQKT